MNCGGRIPEELGECWLERLAERCGGGCGGEPPAERGEPGGNVSATDISAAMGDGPAPLAPLTGGEPAARPSGDPAEPFVNGAGLYPVIEDHSKSIHTFTDNL